MSERRYDWLNDQWVFFSPGRGERPVDFLDSPIVVSHSRTCCPFCPGNENSTPGAIYEEQVGASWGVRVVPNKFPAVSVSENRNCPPSVPKTSDARLGVGQYAPGFHEVIIETPDHDLPLRSFSNSQMVRVFRAYQHRLRSISLCDEIRYVSIFKNSGPDAGASLKHQHSQLVATDFQPTKIARLEARAKQFCESHSECYWCELMAQELDEDSRIAYESDHFIVLAPFASRFAGTIQILPKSHQSSLLEATEPQLRELGKLITSCAMAFESFRTECDFNFALVDFAVHGNREGLHWHIDMFPRISSAAGFEWASGCFINPMTPEYAACMMRGLLRHILPPLPKDLLRVQSGAGVAAFKGHR